MGIGKRPYRAVELAYRNWTLRDTPRSRSLLTRALWSLGRGDVA